MKHHLKHLVAATIVFGFCTFCSAAFAAPLVVVDAGHGGKDSGAIGATGLPEKDANLDVAARVKSLLDSSGLRTLMTRSTDTDVSLSERCDLANSANADLFVSIHNNYTADSAMQGTETYFFNSSGSGRRLADSLQSSLIARLSTVDRGTRSSSFFVLTNTKMTAALVEGVYLSNYGEEQRLRDDGFRQTMAEAIYAGIQEYVTDVLGYTVYRPLPQYIRIHVPSVTSDTRIQVSAYFAATKWVSQPLLAPGDYMIRIDPDGFVRSIDSKLGFVRGTDALNPGVSVYVLNPDSRNGADFASYEWVRNDSYPSGALKWVSGGFVSFEPGSLAISSTGNSIEFSSARETLFNEKIMLRVHLESVTPWTQLRIPFYWKKVAYLSQKPLPAGDYWIQLGPDPNPSDPSSAPYVLSLDGRIPFRQIRLNHNPDQVLGIYVGNPRMGQVGFDVVAFAHNFRRANSLQTMMGPLPTGPDNGLGYIPCLGVADPNAAVPDFATIPTQTLSAGNYIIVTDAGLIRGRIMNSRTGKPFAGARVRIDSTTMTADANGEFSFTHLVPKAYVLEYAADGFSSQTQTISVRPGAPSYTPWCYL